jgi:threonine aldolase
MISFRNDYSEGAHPAVLAALERTNLVSTPGYGCDEFCRAAAEKIKARFACPQADVHFMIGGTITNLTAIAAFLRPWEAVIAASTGHIYVHETGSVEATGHKVYAVPAPGGKLTPALIRQAVLLHRDGNEEHMVTPKLVYLSDATELGTIYTKSELTAIRDACRELGLWLYLDGARMATALVSGPNDLVPEDFAQLCDAFYIGGTKDGLLFGEALVLVNDALKPFFRNVLKQRGGMLAKGRLLGVQFGAFLEDDLWLTIARHANEMAARLASAIREKGYPFYAESCTNQLFPILPDGKVDELRKSFDFDFIAKTDETHTAVRFVTSWATSAENVGLLAAAL